MNFIITSEKSGRERASMRKSEKERKQEVDKRGRVSGNESGEENVRNL